MSRNDPLLLGAVAYDPKVVTIWDGFQAYLPEARTRFDYILYSNYERQVEALIRGPDSRCLELAAGVAAVRAHRRRLGPQARRPSACGTPIAISPRSFLSARIVRSVDVADLKGGRVAVGAKDSPQATLIPLSFLADRDSSRAKISRCCASTCSPASTGTISAASAMPRGRCCAAMPTPPA